MIIDMNLIWKILKIFSMKMRQSITLIIILRYCMNQIKEDYL
ncbi:hypothetical protein SAMN05216218_11588 [Halorientalis regularis]|uniref:Uncharacterized protein n=1 Tax=Halorientalis regularis TaxID=660518 RepID=A0A1G7RND9_9EURY|nr:hypothetical protein SAMN05216218_11588 [Halorientalis regularis]